MNTSADTNPFDFSAQTVLYGRSPSYDPTWNLRLEEALLRNVRSYPVFLLWRNQRTVVIGKNQIAENEVDLRYASSQGIQVVRRSTGGGAVYHDLGNINYTMITDLPEDGGFSLRELAGPVLLALRRMGLPAAFNDRNDIMINGMKVCGTAARLDGNRILSHGCICYNVDLDIMDCVLTPSQSKMARHGIRSVHSRVVPLSVYFPGVSTSQFMNLLEAGILSQMQRVLPLNDAAGDLDSLVKTVPPVKCIRPKSMLDGIFDRESDENNDLHRRQSGLRASGTAL